MKFRLITLFLVLFALLAILPSGFAQTDNVYATSEANKSVNRVYPLTPAMVSAGENAVFDKLVKKEVVSLGTSTFLCPTDTTSTNTAAIAYAANINPPFKVIVTPYDSSTASLTFDLYAKTASGVTAPDTTCLLPITNGRYEKTFFGTPNVIFGANQTGTATVEVWIPNY